MTSGDVMVKTIVLCGCGWKTKIANVSTNNDTQATRCCDRRRCDGGVKTRAVCVGLGLVWWAKPFLRKILRISVLIQKN